MNRFGESRKLLDKSEKVDSRRIDESKITLKEVKREFYERTHRNYENALRSKNVLKLITYDES